MLPKESGPSSDILSEHRAVLDSLAKQLLEYETIDGREVYALIKEMTGQDLGPAAPEPKAPTGGDSQDGAEAELDDSQEEREPPGLGIVPPAPDPVT